MSKPFAQSDGTASGVKGSECGVPAPVLGEGGWLDLEEGWGRGWVGGEEEQSVDELRGNRP